jgi:type IV pilus assembly protein PilO
MNDLIERFLDLPMQRRVLLLGVGVLGIFFLYATYFYWPLGEEIERRRETVAQLESDRDRKKAMVANIEATRKMVADLDARLKKVTAELPDKKEIPELLSNISSLGSDSGLTIIVFRQRPEQFEEFYAQVPVEVRVKGTYHQVGTFFDKVGRLNRIVNVSDISLKEPQNRRDSLVVTSSFTATTYRFLDDAERERIAKQRAQEKKK